MSQQLNILVIDNFYKNPLKVREFALEQEFEVTGNYPGIRTKSFASSELKQLINRYIEPFSGKITEFPMEPTSYNGSFQYTTKEMKSWFHRDLTDFSVVVYLTPDAPINSGTSIYYHKDYNNL